MSVFTSSTTRAELDGTAVAAFLEHLVLVRKVSVGTQSQALNALVFFYRQVSRWG